MPKLSAFVTTFNNADTLSACLASVAFADEILVLDSFSTDETLAVAERHGARIVQHAFMGYGPQKQMALEHTANDWVLLLDADEMLSDALADEVRDVLAGEPTVAGFEMPRREQVFWRMNHPAVRHNHYLRLFDKRRGRVSDMPIHAAPKVDGPVARLEQPFYHFGEKDVHTKVSKVNAYSSGLVREKRRQGRRPHPWVMVIYPPIAFVRSFVFKRGFMDGWAGFIASGVMAFYAFLKYAKLYERAVRERQGQAMLPPGAPAQTYADEAPEGRAPE